MSFKSFFGRLFARFVVAKTNSWSRSPIKTQEKVLFSLIKAARNTGFGVDHNFDSIDSYESFKSQVPVRNYEGLKEYIDRIRGGEKDVLWPGRPSYFAKTSGTTSGAKYIPLTKVSLKCQIQAARNALLHYVISSGNTDFISGKMIFLQGSPELNDSSIVPSGRLSGIVANFVPKYLQANRLPTYNTNCIEDWEAKVEAIVTETLPEDLRLISGIPSWVQMYFEKLVDRSGKKVGELFPNFSLFVYGGVNYEPYRKKFDALIGRNIDSIELYPASEGFIAFQDKHDKKDLLLLLDYGIFYEFIAVDSLHKKNPERISIKDVKLGVNYVIILNTNAGLWGYNIGDTVQFTSLNPYRIVVSGRVKHFTSAFGEHVIAKEVEQALKFALDLHPDVSVNEFTVAPQISPKKGLPYHEWFIEFSSSPKNMKDFRVAIDGELQNQNAYYKDLIEGRVLQPLKINSLPKNSFNKYMKKIGKLGGQNKVPRLANDRKIVDLL